MGLVPTFFGIATKQRLLLGYAFEEQTCIDIESVQLFVFFLRPTIHPSDRRTDQKNFKTDNAYIGWWNSTKTLSISGKRKDDFRKTLRSLYPIKSQESNKDSDSQNREPDRQRTSSNCSSHLPNMHPDITNSFHQEIRNIWSLPIH